MTSPFLGGCGMTPAAGTPSLAAAVATGIYDNISGLVMDAGGARRSGVTVVLHSDGTQHGKRWLREADGTIRPSYDTGLCLTVPKAGVRHRREARRGDLQE